MRGITRALGQPQRIVAYNTYQVKDYDRYELASFSEEAKHQWRDAHWEEDLLNTWELVTGQKTDESLTVAAMGSLAGEGDATALENFSNAAFKGLVEMLKAVCKE